MRRRNNRVAMNLPVELIADGKRMRAVSQDVSPLGMFIRLSPPLPVGTVVQIVMSPNGQRLLTAGRVTHALAEVEARTLGRFPGIGVAFREPVRPADQQFAEALTRMIERHAQHQPPADIRMVVADSETRVLERLSTALGTAGFSVATATNGMEAIGACLSRTPDVVLVERDMPVVDGLHVLAEMGRHAELASVPVMMMASEATDLIRLQAFQLGAMDFIPKPFTVLEVILRARRLARASQRDSGRVVLRGALAELGLPSLLTMFEQERKSGQLTLTRDQVVAWIDFTEGKIVRARSTEIDADSRTVLMNVLDWQAGYFELAAGSALPSSPDLSASVTHLLLEHARLRDEAAR
ncbi:MAG TPA: response regulator [Kofleriaceae bacterium]|nr:response regulator [Kofleriaceae bacterium]